MFGEHCDWMWLFAVVVWYCYVWIWCLIDQLLTGIGPCSDWTCNYIFTATCFWMLTANKLISWTSTPARKATLLFKNCSGPTPLLGVVNSLVLGVNNKESLQWFVFNFIFFIYTYQHTQIQQIKTTHGYYLSSWVCYTQILKRIQFLSTSNPIKLSSLLPLMRK